jgi:hypothetical protein
VRVGVMVHVVFVVRDLGGRGLNLAWLGFFSFFPLPHHRAVEQASSDYQNSTP